MININQEKLSQFKKQECKNKAKILISQSDWSVLPDVKILNKSEFELYRSKLRAYILEPVEDPIFPIEPNPIWSN
jgi:PHD/YefM family antitoxin component YafN of YafNO toxin-antitoxin module